jgi:hypothetical protein
MSEDRKPDVLFLVVEGRIRKYEDYHRIMSGSSLEEDPQEPAENPDDEFDKELWRQLFMEELSKRNKDGGSKL